MSSTKPEKFTFSFDDFEKGLMLAGLVPPANAAELEEREALETFEKDTKKKDGELYFKRAVLAAEIASQLCNEFTFGRIKFQKLVYLCEHAAHMNLQHRYSKQAAGPFDNKFMHSIEQEFKKQNWFAVEKVKEGNFIKPKYTPLPTCDNYKKYYYSYFGNDAERIMHVINLFRKARTDKAEIAATLFACALELRTNGENVSEKRLLEMFYNWSERKGQYDRRTVLSIWEWMKEQGLVNQE
jgi:uncharacterized protein YwgA